MRITPEYESLNRQMHESEAFTGDDSVVHAEAILRFAERIGAESILDYGCGCGALVRELGCEGYDPSRAEYSQDPSPCDLVVSIDVLEHIEPECLPDVLAHMRALALKGLYLHICTGPDESKTLPDGTNPHRIIESPAWWARTLNGYFTVEQIGRSRKHITFLAW